MSGIDFHMPILIVDEYKTMVRLIRNRLRQLGFDNVDAAPDGGTALGKLRSKAYSLVISDWHMKPMSGLELLRQVRADTRLKRLPFIMLAPDGRSDKVAAAERAGVSSYLVKPFDAGTLADRLASVIGAF
jgi:two-component system chemotaxis response regulator CheY